VQLLILGDTHGDLRYAADMIKSAKDWNCHAIVQVGDWGYTWPGYETNHSLQKLDRFLAKSNMHMYFIDGNHDNYSDLQKRGAWQAREMQHFTNFVTYIPRGHVWEWDGVRFMAMGGAYSIDQEHRVQGQSWWPEELISYADMDYAARQLETFAPIDVFLSHDCPEGVRKLETYLELTTKEYGISYKMDEASRGNRRALRTIVEEAQPKVLYHGHYHWPYADTLKYPGKRACRVLGLSHNWEPKESWALFDTKKYREEMASVNG
jgi:predicted phosphodiesterase